jgi:hypothetical protein
LFQHAALIGGDDTELAVEQKLGRFWIDETNSLPRVNGFWAVEIARAGTYRFTMRHQPAEAKCVLKAVQARVKMGEVEKAVEAYSTALKKSFDLSLYNDNTAYATRRLGELRPEIAAEVAEEHAEIGEAHQRVENRPEKKDEQPFGQGSPQTSMKGADIPTVARPPVEGPGYDRGR